MGATDAQAHGQRISLQRQALDVLGELAAADSASDQREHEERLEIRLLILLLQNSDPADFKYLPRLNYLVGAPSADKSPFEKVFGYYFGAMPFLMMGDQLKFAEAFLSSLFAAAEYAQTHPDESFRNQMCQCESVVLLAVRVL